MKETQLPKSVSGEKLVQILERASSKSGFEFEEVKGEKTLAYYLATFHEPVTPLNAFSDKPSLQLRFVGVERDKQYSFVRYRTDVCGIFCREPQEINIDEDIQYKKAHDKFFRQVDSLTKE